MSDTTRPLWLQTIKGLGIAASVAALAAIYLPELPVVGRLFYPFYYRPAIEQQAKVFGLDPLFVATVIRQESGFRPHARSGVGAVGLMQIMPKTAQWASAQLGIKNFDVSTLEDPSVNLRVGCWYLRYLFTQFHDPAMVLAAYNGGEGNLAYWGTLQGEQLKHAFPETQGYVAQGMKTYARYKALYQPEVARVTAPGVRVLGR
jgi:soluble lytic murein transglycosylase